MEIKVLAEDTSSSPAYRSEHGLSLYIETENNKILFDTGASDLFLENAKSLDVNIDEIDLAVISHGHYDHGGGLQAFLEENSKAKVYIHEKAFENHYSKKTSRIVNIGLDKNLSKSDRIILTGDIFPISHDLLLFSRVVGNEFIPSCNNSLCTAKGDSIIQDEFEHEQSLIIKDGDHFILIAGCAHRGIVNILKSSVFLTCKPPSCIIGGFHLYNYSEGVSEEPARVIQIAEFLKGTGSMYYTGHCTGTDSYGILKGIMDDQIQYLSTGSVVEI
jgi:7,8-dihydropterin-6-yl-methyl-4-(beta-D-ribofuranosyl)aminobenzene 5'-phosphate synthase